MTTFAVMARSVASGAAVVLAIGCTKKPQLPAPAPAPVASVSAPLATGPALTYEVVASGKGEVLDIDARFAPGQGSELSVDDGAEPFVSDVRIEDASGAHPLAAQGTSWIAPSCTTLGCRITYRFHLADAARKLDDIELAKESNGAYLAPPSTWLMHPLEVQPGAKFRFHVTTARGVSFATGVFPAKDAAGVWEGDAADLPQTPYSAFGPLRTTAVEVPGGSLDVALCPGPLAVTDDTILSWIKTAAGAVAGYFGRFPVARALVVVRPTEGWGFGYAKALGNGGASIVVPIGARTREDEFRDEWVLPHEMIHLGFPTLPRRHIWLEEGIATYVEPIARARAGLISPEDVWKGLAKGLPHGLPKAGDRGLDNTPTWGRTYWGGALFCLLADLEIREKTHNARSLDDALRGVLAAGGNTAVRWSLERALDEGDRAVGVAVLRPLHQQMGLTPMPVDLPSLFNRLGVHVQNGRVTFDEQAPLAEIRQSITAKEPGTATR